MVRLSHIDPAEANYLASLECPTFETQPFVAGPPLSMRKVALVSTAGLHLRGDRPFGPDEAGYRVIPSTVEPADLVMSHISTNYDRTGFIQDHNVVFPLDRLRELEKEGAVGSLAEYHYSFMGATHPAEMETKARETARLMKAEGVEAVLLVPV